MVGLVESLRGFQAWRNTCRQWQFLALSVDEPEQPEVLYAEPEHEEFVRREGVGNERRQIEVIRDHHFFHGRLFRFVRQVISRGIFR